ncbi:DUF1844 domain-containing protein [Roseimaritima ulvae]|uniref:DUF1844 domain-containing protein n=1 Tax=Roseimaritima ulvae TaxID=980254 RepID=A0A5B9QZ28_9BACT|nr:DUF1844 domain-containing protein [Roseimaritima ulvae]QEG43312.1 hypothetical protein UC8_53590 [Roseimaritima ulvae]
MTDSNAEDDPKLIIDEDWKEQVQKEKEALRAAQAENADAGEGQGREAEVQAAGDADGADQTPPPASFVTLVSMLFTQAMAMLGQIPDPTSGKPSVNKPIAKHYIDTLEMLEEKTKGNLDEEEGKMISEALHALRMTYVSVKGTETAG